MSDRSHLSVEQTPLTPSSSNGIQSPNNFTSNQPNSMLPSINQGFDRESQRTMDTESRRSSLDSRMNQGISSLALTTPTSYANSNPSQQALVTGLQRERGMPSDYNGPTPYRGPRVSRNDMTSPLGPRSQRPLGGRIAPAISNNPDSGIYNAEAPTAGMAYAFPDPGAAQQPRLSQQGQNPPSRRGSIAESFASSIVSADSRLPPGQRGKFHTT